MSSLSEKYFCAEVQQQEDQQEKDIYKYVYTHTYEDYIKPTLIFCS